MKRRFSKQEEEEFSLSRKDNNQWVEPAAKGSKKSHPQEYKCGKSTCGKIYHSYTAFYNHCKKNHSGQFPAGSLINDKLFQGPSKNRGRPRIKKNDAKDQVQIQSMRTQNQLIEFLGTLKSKKNQELIVYVESPIERLQGSIGTVEGWQASEYQQYFTQLLEFNKIVTQKDLPQFYDPIQVDNYKDNLDSYNFNSIYNYMVSNQNREKHKINDEGQPLLQKILIVWLARILSEKLLAEVIYSICQIRAKADKIIEKQLLIGKSSKFKQIIQKFFNCFLMERKQSLNEINQQDDDNDS